MMLPLAKLSHTRSKGQFHRFSPPRVPSRHRRLHLRNQQHRLVQKEVPPRRITKLLQRRNHCTHTLTALLKQRRMVLALRRILLLLLRPPTLKEVPHRKMTKTKRGKLFTHSLANLRLRRMMVIPPQIKNHLTVESVRFDLNYIYLFIIHKYTIR